VKINENSITLSETTEERLLEYLPLLVVNAGLDNVFKSILPFGGGNLGAGTLYTIALTANENLSLEVIRV
jgi:hypothetical protein